MRGCGVAVVGTGFIGPVHVEGLRRSGQRVVGILGSSPAKSHKAAAALGIATAYDSYESLLADPQVEAVHLTTPNRFHYREAVAALEAGKHVLCEKPLAMTTAESAALVQLAATKQVAAGVNYNLRYYPIAQESAARFRQGDVGTLYHVAGSYVQDWLFHQTDFNWRVLAEDGGELRAVADIGTHWLDLLQFITGQPIIAVCADLQTVFSTREKPAEGSVETFTAGGAVARTATHAIPITTDDIGSILLKFANGAKGVLWVSQVTAGRKNCLRYEIAGSKCALAWESERPEELWVGHRDTHNQVVLRNPPLLSARARAFVDYPGGHNEGHPDTFKMCFRDFYGAIARGDVHATDVFPTFADGHREIVLCEAILQSHREQRWVSV